MRDPAVLAVFAVRITAAEHAAILAGRPIVRPFWPTVDDEEPDEPIAGDHMLTPMLALDNCADACDAIENPDTSDD